MESLENRLAAFDQLGVIMIALGKGSDWPGYHIGLGETEYAEANDLIAVVKSHNGWFTEDNVRKSFLAWGHLLTAGNLSTWLSKYEITERGSRTIGVVMAGNIPIVGFHDLLCVLVLGHQAQVKLSSDDKVLLPMLMGLLSRINPIFDDKVDFRSDKLTEYDAVIATGSNNTSRYFSYYFKHVPHLIRKNRTSVAILHEEITAEEIKDLSRDIFDYYGLGCRNISKMYLPKSFKIDRFFEGIFDQSEVANHHKYANNYDYNKAVWLLNRADLLDNGFFLLKEDESLFAPTASIYYERYEDESSLREDLLAKQEDIQCIVSKSDIPFGKAQEPELWDYADGADTVEFLLTV